MKKLIVLILMAALLAVSLCACSTGLPGKTTTATEAPAASAEPTVSATVEPAAEDSQVQQATEAPNN